MNENKPPMCILAGNNIYVNGDVAFAKKPFTNVYLVTGTQNIYVNNSVFCNKTPKIKDFKLWCLWVWHMNILRKDCVYLTGVLRK